MITFFTAGNAGNHGNEGKFKVTKYLTKFKATLINYVWEKSHVKKTLEKNFTWIPFFRICTMTKNENPEIYRKSTESFLNQKSTQCYPFTVTRKLVKCNHFVM